MWIKKNQQQVCEVFGTAIAFKYEKFWSIKLGLHQTGMK